MYAKPSIGILDGMCLGLSLLVVSWQVHAQAPEEFYAKKPLRILVGTDVGGSYDLMGRLMARHLSRHIPGHPSIIVENMPGGGSMVATNYLYNVAPQDGSVLGVVVSGIILNALFKDDVVRFDVAKMQWIGNAMEDVTVTTVFYTSPYKTLDEIKRHEVLMGAGGISSFDATNVLFINALVGTKFRVVQGYKGGDDINLAMERGEIQGRGGQAWSGWNAVRPEWIKENKLIPLIQLSLKPLPDPKLKDVPLLIDLVQDEDSKKLATVYSSLLSLGRPMVMGPDVPKDRIETLRRAFLETADDPLFRTDAIQLRVNIGVISGEEMQTMVSNILNLDSRLVNKLGELIRKQK